MGSRSDLTDAQWELLEPLLPVSNGRCGRWRDHRQVVNGVLYRIRTGVQWRDLRVRSELIDRLAEVVVVREVRRSAARVAGSLPGST